MDFAYSDRVQELRGRLLDFFDRHIYPNEATYHHQHATAADRWQPVPIVVDGADEGMVRVVGVAVLARHGAGEVGEQAVLVDGRVGRDGRRRRRRPRRDRCRA